MTIEKWMPPQEWLDSLDAQERAKADRMIAILERFGADDPVSWVSSELREDIPQVARFLFLHEIRSRLLNPFSYGRSLKPGTPDMNPAEMEARGDQAYQRLLDAGANPDDIEDVARGAASRTVFEFISLLDGVLESEYDAIEEAPRWKLAEVTGPLEESELTGRCLDSLHESLYDMYPTDS